MLDISPHEWDVVKYVEDIEKDYMCKLFNKFQPARTAIQACGGVFNNLQYICRLLMEQGSEFSPGLVKRIHQLKRWVRFLDDRKRARSEAHIRTAHLELLISGQQNLHADWAPYSDQSERIKRLILDQINFHNMRYGRLENLLVMVDALLD
jgi:hypothetical protein